LAQEKQLADTLRAHSEEMGVARECIRTLEAKVEALMTHHTAQNEQHQLDVRQSAEMMDMLNLKYFNQFDILRRADILAG
jgi:uncharacterized protein YigA (DUF484 family)